MYSFILNKKAYTIPQTASELKLGQFMDIYNLQHGDELGMLTALMGETPEVNIINKKDAGQLQRELAGVYALIDNLNADLENTINSGQLLIHPKRIEILGLNIELKPNFVNSLPYWGFIHTKQIILNRIQYGKDEKFDATPDIAGILAHNLYTLVSRSPYNEEKAEEFIEVVREVNFIQAMQLGNFFLLQQKDLWTSRRKRWTIRLNLWRLRLVSKFFRSTDPRIHSKPLAEEIFYNGKK